MHDVIAWLTCRIGVIPHGEARYRMLAGTVFNDVLFMSGLTSHAHLSGKHANMLHTK